MAEKDQGTLAEITRALRQVGFTRDWRAPGPPTFRGLLDPSDLAASVSIEIVDTDLVRPPVIRLGDQVELGRVAPHVLGPGRVLCYLEPRAIILDRYNPGGAVLLAVGEAERVLRDALRGRSDEDFVDEFATYWSGSAVYVDLPPGAAEGQLYWVAMRDAEQTVGILAKRDGLAKTFLDRHRSLLGDDANPSSSMCPILEVQGALTVNASAAWPPDRLGDLLTWLETVAPSVVPGIGRAVDAPGGGASVPIGLRATNGLFLFVIEVPPRFQTKEFLETRRRNLFRTLRSQPGGANASITRCSTWRIDAEYLYGRNLLGNGLAQKRVVLVGCGAIGGMLALQLAKTGAGAQGGLLTLVDSDRLEPANLGRHLLGVEALGANKAEALSTRIQSELPHLKVEARAADALSVLDVLQRHDLVIDATGEEALSIALNHHAQLSRPRFPPLLHVWLHGNGAAAEALLNDVSGLACYKCLKPKLDEPPRFRLLRPDAPMEVRRNYACGDQYFAPYPISRATSAASMALDMALAWAAKVPSPRHRTMAFDQKHVFTVKPSDPARSHLCPACRDSQ